MREMQPGAFMPTGKPMSHSMYGPSSEQMPMNSMPYRFATSHPLPSSQADSMSFPSASSSTTAGLLQGNPAMDLAAMKNASNGGGLAHSVYAPLHKHWIWNANLFYPNAGPRSMHDSFLPYSANLTGFFGQHPKGRHSSEPSTLKDEHSDTDSLDVSDGKLSPSASTASTVSSPPASKKRNPYSIEELLKKPEKRIRMEPIAFQPPILIHNRSHSRSKSPESPNDLRNVKLESAPSEEDSIIDIENNNNATIEICD